MKYIQAKEIYLFIVFIVGVVAVIGFFLLFKNVENSNEYIIGQAYIKESVINAKSTIAPLTKFCSDSDGGKDYTVQGHIVGGTWHTTGETYTTKTDSCLTNDKVKEYYCYDRTHGYYNAVSCSGKFGAGYICEEGACVMKISILEIEDAEIASNKITYAIRFENDGTSDIEDIEINCNLYVYNLGYETLYDEDVTETIDLPAGEITPVYCIFDTTEAEKEGSLAYKVAEEQMEVRASLTVEIADIEETHSEEWTEESFSFIPNVAILEFEEDDSCRYSNGNVHGECVVEEFYSVYPDNFDMLIIMDVGEYNGLYNGYSSESIHRYVPTNIGRIDECDVFEYSFCETYPERLRYMQQIGDALTEGLYPEDAFVHEAGHYWGVSWRSPGSRYDECFDEPWMEQIWENNHWTELFQAGEESSVLSYHISATSERDSTHVAFGPWVDNGDGTFTKTPSEYGNLKFNYIDLYAMGLMSEEEVETKEMYVVLDPVRVNDADGYVYSGTRYDLILDDFKDLLAVKEECEGTGTEYYYTGDGSRELHSYDGETELAESFRIGMVLIKFPEQTISDQEAYEICEAVNYNLPIAWSEATDGLSEIDLRLEEGSSLPDCFTLYPGVW